MKHIGQLAIILVFTYCAEVLVTLLNIPFPGSILGMLALFVFLKLGLIKIHAIEETGNYLLSILPIMFVPLGVGIMAYFDVLKKEAIPFLVIIGVSTALVMGVSGWLVQMFKKKAGEYSGL